MKIGIIGLGAMGSRVAMNLAKEHDIYVYNRTRSKAKSLGDQGAVICGSPKDVVANTEIIFSFLTDDNAVREVWLGKDGAIHSLNESKTVLESSTLSYSFTKDLIKEFTDKNHLIAPVVGSRPQAESKQLIYLLGGRQEVYKKVKKVIESLSIKHLFFSEALKACSLKLTINSLLGIQTVAFAEFYTALNRSGFEKDETYQILNGLPLTSPIMQMMLGLFHEEMYEPLFPIELVEKDFRYASEFLIENNIKSFVTTSAHEAFKKANESSLSNQNISGVINLFTGGHNEKNH